MQFERVKSMRTRKIAYAGQIHLFKILDKRFLISLPLLTGI